jgi:hypothetical protein
MPAAGDPESHASDQKRSPQQATQSIKIPKTGIPMLLLTLFSCAELENKYADDQDLTTSSSIAQRLSQTVRLRPPALDGYSEYDGDRTVLFA